MNRDANKQQRIENKIKEAQWKIKVQIDIGEEQQ